MFDRPRNWKWMVPGALTPVCLWWWNDWYRAGGEWASLSIVPLSLVLVLGIATLVNLFLYIYDNWTQMYAVVRHAQNNTPEVRMFEAARAMHPETVKNLTVHRRTIWRLKYVPIKDLVDWVLDEAENVHAGFVDFVLDHSSSVALMPKRLLSQGSKGFDPDDRVSDYEQYDSLVLLLQQKLMVTAAYGNQAPQWMPPWSPDLARHRFGLDGAVGADPEELSDQLRAVVRAQESSRSHPLTGTGVPGSKVGGSGNGHIYEEPLKGLEQTSPSMKSATDEMLKS